MGAQILSMFNRPTRPARGHSDWTQQEIAEFYRVESALIRAGLRIETDRGLSDEGEPWFVFLRGDDGEVVIHFARIDGEYVIAGPAYAEIYRGLDFTGLVRNMIARHPLVQPQRRDSNVMMHPAALLIAIVGTAFFKSGEAKAMENAPAAAARRALAAGPAAAAPLTSPGATRADVSTSVHLDANQALTILAGAMFALEHAEQVSVSGARAALDLTAATTLSAPHLSVVGPHDAPHGLMTFNPEPASNTALAVQQASMVLSLIAVLETLATPGSAELITVSTPTVAPLDQPTTATPAPGSPPAELAGRVTLEVDLEAGATLNVIAVRLLMEIEPGRFNKIGVVELAKLPAAISSFVFSGMTDGLTVTPDLPPPAATNSHQGDQTPATSDTGSKPDGGGAEPVGLGRDAPPVEDMPAPSAGIRPIDVPSTQSSAASIMATDQWNLASKLIQYFIDHTALVDVVTSGSEVIFIDDRVLHRADLLNHVDVVTFNFEDGSSVSLVGEYSVLHHDFN